MVSGCKKEEIRVNVLSAYVCEDSSLERGMNVIACAGGSDHGLKESGEEATIVFFYPEAGSFDFKYFEAPEVKDSTNYEAYVEIELCSQSEFNGFLRKYSLGHLARERMVIVTYRTPGKIHISDPIRLKTPTKPTELNSELVTVNENSIEPEFIWTPGVIDENVIYFQLIMEQSDDVISATYTIDENFTFYNLDNVVLNVSSTDPEPILEPNSTYKFALMGVSEDNWINMLSFKEFST